MKEFSQIREGMKINFNVPITMRDGNVLRANVYRPMEDGQYPIILSYGPYGKDLHIEDVYSTCWETITRENPHVRMNSSNLHQAWEVVDPETWCKDGYICVRVDSRGAGCSAGKIDVWSHQEAEDAYDCIEWAGIQPWSNGKVGICGISYYATIAWMAAELQPPHLAGIVVWEGFTDYYRDSIRTGGIAHMMQSDWAENQIHAVQYGVGDNGYKSRVTGENVSGDVNLTELELVQNRVDIAKDVTPNHEMLDAYMLNHGARDVSKVKCPLLAAANWGLGLHSRGTIEGFMKAGSEEKFLEVHGLEHWLLFYSQYGMKLKKDFFDHYLKGIDNGWEKRQRVQLQVRHINDQFEQRMEDEFPLARTEYVKLYLDPENYQLTENANIPTGTISYRGMGDGVTFMTLPQQEDVEYTGLSAAKLFVSSSTTDADIFLVLRLFAPDMTEVTFRGSNDPHTPVGLGWLRASHRKLDPALSKPYKPWHTHDEKMPLTPNGEPVELDVEIWPMSIVVPKGYRLGLTIRGKDYVNAIGAAQKVIQSNNSIPLTGCGTLVHTNKIDRPDHIFNGDVTLHFDAKNPPYLLMPKIPEK